MKKEFEMSMVGELTYFFGLQLKRMDSGMFISQTKYARNLDKRFGLDYANHAWILLSTTTKLAKDEAGKFVYLTKYRSIIRSRLYLTASRP